MHSASSKTTSGRIWQSRKKTSNRNDYANNEYKEKDKPG